MKSDKTWQKPKLEGECERTIPTLSRCGTAYYLRNLTSRAPKVYCKARAHIHEAKKPDSITLAISNNEIAQVAIIHREKMVGYICPAPVRRLLSKVPIAGQTAMRCQFQKSRFFSLDVLLKEFRILRVSRFRHSAILERAVA